MVVGKKPSHPLRLKGLPAGWLEVISFVVVPNGGLQEWVPNMVVLAGDGWALERLQFRKESTSSRVTLGVISVRLTRYRHLRIVVTRGVKYKATLIKSTYGGRLESCISNY